MKEFYTVFRNGDARETFDTFDEASDYISFFANHDRTAKPDHWEIGEYKENGDLIEMSDMGDGHFEEI